MKTIGHILEKEFIQIRRNRVMLPMMIVMPIVQLLILVHAATFEMKHIRMHILDLDKSGISRQIINKFKGSPFYEIINFTASDADAENDLLNNNADVILKIPSDFEKKLALENKAKVQIIINAINATTAGLINAYTSSILADYNKNLIAEWTNAPALLKSISIRTTYSFWYNPELNYSNFMVPGILVLLVTMIGVIMSSMNIVREKEIGTIEQINVTPIKKYQFIIGKLLPFWIIALFELGFGLFLGKILFNIPIVGNLGLLFAFASVYLLAILGIGLFISSVNNTQQQAMFISWFFMVIFILMSGLFTPVESMPQWAQYINIINPVAYFIEVTRMILLKGSGLADIKKHFVSIAVYAVIIINLAVFKYRKTN
ncbi:MAG: ABC transporter permease [Bacteroidia bacterium]|nr:ABC transporter permease [Bacteroidia bacterium]